MIHRFGLLLCSILIGCGNGSECSEENAEFNITWENWGEGFFISYCNGCHSSDSSNRFGAPENITFDTQKEAQEWLDRIHIRTVQTTDMPPGGGVIEEDLEFLEIWLDCGMK